GARGPHPGRGCGRHAEISTGEDERAGPGKGAVRSRRDRGGTPQRRARRTGTDPRATLRNGVSDPGAGGGGNGLRGGRSLCYHRGPRPTGARLTRTFSGGEAGLYSFGEWWRQGKRAILRQPRRRPGRAGVLPEGSRQVCGIIGYVGGREAKP